MRYIKGVALFGLIILFSFGCAQFGKVIGKFLTGTTDDLNEASTQVRYTRNTYPPEINTTEVGYFDDWIAGRNAVGINSFKREGAGMLKIDGTVTANGVEIPYVDNGAYGMFLDGLEPQTVEIKTNSGQEVSFYVEPIEEVNIKNVNGGSGELDLTKDLVLEFEEPTHYENKDMRLLLLTDFMGTRSWMDVANFKAVEKVVIPAEAFKHLPGVRPNEGESYLLVERYKVSPNINEGIGAAQVLSISWDAVPVTVTNRPQLIHGIDATGEIENDKGNIEYRAAKPNAFLGKPFSEGKKFALTSLTVRATKLKQQRSKTTSSTSYYSNYKVTTTTTTTQTRKFPTLPDIFWDNLIDGMYEGVVATLNKNMGAEFIPMDQVTAAPSFQKLEPIDDGITEVEVQKSYPGTKPLLPTTFGAIMSSVSTTFASDRIDAKLIDELGVDGLVAVTVDLEMPWEEFTLTPRMSFRITGAPNGYLYGPTVFAEGVITGQGVELDEAKENSEIGIDLLNQIVQQEQLIQAFDEALRELQATEQSHGYEKIWALQD